MLKTEPVQYERPKNETGQFISWEPLTQYKYTHQDGNLICPISEPHKKHRWQINYNHNGIVNYSCNGVGYQS